MFDSQTTLILAALLFACLPLLMWWTAPHERDTAVGWWYAGSWSATCGLVMLSLRPWLPSWMGYHLASTCLLASLLLWSQSFRVSLDRGWRGGLLALWCVGGLAYYSVLHAALVASVRTAGLRMGLAALALYTALLGWQLWRRTRSHNAAAIAACYFVLGLGLILQSAWDAYLLAGSSLAALDPKVPSVLALGTAAVSHFCYTGMRLEAASQRQALALGAQVAADEAERLERRLNQFDRQQRMLLVSGSLAHELNQPLSAALTEAQLALHMLESGRVDASAVARQADKAAASLWRTSALLERIRSPGDAPERCESRLDLREVATVSVALMDATWRELGVKPRWSLPEHPLWCRGDELALSQVLVNLLSNATQAMSHVGEPRIDIRGWEDGGEVKLSITDSGPGIPADVLQRCGEAFIGDRQAGLGLGLAISQGIMHRHQGRLLLCNQPQGGAQATLVLKRCEASS